MTDDGIKLYGAYGSNMNQSQMKERCPYAIPAGVGTLRNYRLVFKGDSSYGGGVATIEPTDPYDECSIPVMLWDTTPRCEEALDRYEGYPKFYDKRWLPVDVVTKGKRHQVFAFFYVMTEGRDYNPPSARYLGIIREGYQALNIETDNLEETAKNGK